MEILLVGIKPSKVKAAEEKRQKSAGVEKGKGEVCKG